MTPSALTAMQQGLQSCETCGLLSRPAPGTEHGRCPRCDEEIHFRKPSSLQRSWAFVLAAAVCYVPANLLPVMTTTTAAGPESDTILQGVVLLWSPTGWPLSLIVLIASIMIPSAKILAMAYLLITVQRGSIRNNEQRVRLYRLVDLVGRWSMVDVFVAAFTAALVQLQPLMSVAPAPGLFFFAAVVVMTMLAVESFDPRLIWDSSSSGAAGDLGDGPSRRPHASAASSGRAKNVNEIDTTTVRAEEAPAQLEPSRSLASSFRQLCREVRHA
jgi:paraquat-inducible protein A